MKLSLIIEALDRASRPVDRVKKATVSLGTSTDRTSRTMRGFGRDMDGAARSAVRLDRAASRIGPGIASSTRRGVRALAELDRRIQFSQAQMEKMAYRSGSLIGGTLRSGLMAGTMIAGAGLSAALYKVVTAGLTFEKFRTQLEGLEGSVAAGNRALAWVSDFAARTPYELNQVMEAYIALKAYGIDPTDGALRTLGDTAAGMGKGLMQAVEMIADAQTGEFERIKEFGIKASVAGDKVTFRWQKNGKELSKTVKQSATDIKKALFDIMDGRFSGGMQRLALTTEGKWSNLMDGLTRTANRVWEGGFGGAVNAQITRINGALDKMEKDGSLKKWADETGKGIGDFVDVLGHTDWAGIAGGVRTVGGAFSDLAGFLRDVDYYGGKVRGFLGNAENLWGHRGDLGSVSWNKRFGGLDYNAPAWMRPAPVKPKSNGVPFNDALAPQNPAPRPRTPPTQDWRRAMNRPNPLAPAAKPAPAPKGKLEISIKTDAGTTAKPTKVATSGMDISVNTGRAMGGFA